MRAPEFATTTRERERNREGVAHGNTGGEPVDPTERGMRISASSKGGPRRWMLSISRGNERENRLEEERRWWGG